MFSVGDKVLRVTISWLRIEIIREEYVVKQSNKKSVFAESVTGEGSDSFYLRELYRDKGFYGYSYHNEPFSSIEETFLFKDEESLTLYLLAYAYIGKESKTF